MVEALLVRRWLMGGFGLAGESMACKRRSLPFLTIFPCTHRASKKAFSLASHLSIHNKMAPPTNDTTEELGQRTPRQPEGRHVAKPKMPKMPVPEQLLVKKPEQQHRRAQSLTLTDEEEALESFRNFEGDDLCFKQT